MKKLLFIALATLAIGCASCAKMSKTLLFVEPRVRTCSALMLDRPASPVQDIAYFTFCLPDSGHTRVAIQNVSLQDIAIVTDSMLCRDEYTVAWDATKAPAGVYYVSLTWRTEHKLKKFAVHH